MDNTSGTPMTIGGRKPQNSLRPCRSEAQRWLSVTWRRLLSTTLQGGRGDHTSSPATSISMKTGRTLKGPSLRAEQLRAYSTAPNAPGSGTRRLCWVSGVARGGGGGGGGGGTGGRVVQNIVQGELVPAVHARLDVQLLPHQDVLLLHVGVHQRHLRSRAGPLRLLGSSGCCTPKLVGCHSRQSQHPRTGADARWIQLYRGRC